MKILENPDNKEQFLSLLKNRDYESISEMLSGGFDLNTFSEEKESLLHQALKKQDHKLLYLLWKNGAKADHPYLNELFLDFDKGFIPA